MTRLLLIRHAATDWVGRKIAGRMDGVPLTGSGYDQAHRLARALAAEAIAAVYSSPRERARETASVLANALGDTVRVASEIDEIDYGDWTGRTIGELEPVPEWQAFNTVRSCTRIPNGELMLEVQARVVRFLEQLSARHPEQSVAVVTHGDLIRAALVHYLGVPLDCMLRLEISPASVTVVGLEQNGPAILCVNHTEPLWER